jgi:polyisoprenoid-binding protein YceI
MIEGTHRLGPDSGRLLVRTSRSGLGRRVGHDLLIEATRWSAEASAERLEVTVEVDALEIREGTGGVLPLSDSDRSEIKKNLRKILDVDRHPVITFVATDLKDPLDVTGELTIKGVTRPLTIRSVQDEGRLRGEVRFAQSTWGIKPYSAFLGALKLADEVEVSFDLGL